MNNSLRLEYFMRVLRQHIKLIVGVIIIVLLADIFVTFGVMKTKYTSTTQLLVNQKLSKDQLAAQAQQLQTDVQRVYTYKDIISSPVIQNKVKSDLRDRPGIEKASVQVENQQNSQVFSISAISTNPYTSADIANDTASIFQNKIKKMMSINSITVVSKAQPKLKPTSPHYALNIVVGLLLGLLLGLFAAIVADGTNKKVNSLSYLEDDLGLNNLGIVAEISEKEIENTVSSKNHRKNDHRRRV